MNSHIINPFPFASSPSTGSGFEMPIRGAPLQGMSTELDTNGFEGRIQ